MSFPRRRESSFIFPLDTRQRIFPTKSRWILGKLASGMTTTVGFDPKLMRKKLLSCILMLRQRWVAVVGFTRLHAACCRRVTGHRQRLRGGCALVQVCFISHRAVAYEIFITHSNRSIALRRGDKLIPNRRRHGVGHAYLKCYQQRTDTEHWLLPLCN